MQPSESFPAAAPAPSGKPANKVFPLSLTAEWAILGLIFFTVYFAALFSPSLLDDADSTHAQAAQHMVLSGDYVTLKVDGIRYLEKPPLPYWLAAADYHIFGFNVFATHLPQTLAVLGCALLAFFWGRRAYGERTAFYAALAFLTSIGVFLFTRWFIPEAILTLLIALALYLFLTGLEDRRPSRIYWTYAMLALAMLAKGLIAPVFFLAAVIPYLLLTGEYRRWREFRLLSGTLLFLLIAAPWHIVASLHNPDQGHPVGNIPTYGNVHGFLYFYFINEHVLRFLGKRYPHDYNKQPAYVFWLSHLIWLFPWSLYWPAALHRAWRNWRKQGTTTSDRSFLGRFHNRDFAGKTTLLLAMYAGFILIFFSLSTNQEYYTYPAYFPLLLLTAVALAGMEEECLASRAPGSGSGAALTRRGDLRWLRGAHALFALVGIGAAAALGYGLWSSRHLPYVADIGLLLAHRDVGGYSLSMSHFFDLTGPSFAALRLPAALAAITLLIGPGLAWLLRARRRHLGATLTTAATAAIFLIAAHIAFARFAPMMSSRAIADTVNRLAAPHDVLMLYGDQSYGSSIIFYTQRPADLVDGRSTSMLWGSCYPDAPHIFLTDADLLARWGHGPRKFLFVPGKYRNHVEKLLQGRYTQLQEISDKVLLTDRPLSK
ncbi:MAG TPA: glycosyltransferase family 39 protein [Acidobacteriaceae bacterium]|nr:glycosyltransferase family 39 protein [Acidobacteriaceae bacterium]